MSDLGSGRVTRIFEQPVAGAVLSPDGKRVAFGQNNKLMIMDNDGGNVETIAFDTALSFLPERGQFSWSWNGIFWGRKPFVHRCDLETGSVTTYPEFDARDGPGKGYWGSLDGRRAWVYFDLVPIDDPDRHGHGDMAYLTFSEDFSSYSNEPHQGVGYGHFLTLDGRYVLIGWDTELLRYPFETGVQDSAIDTQLSDRLESRSGITPCLNRIEVVMIRSRDLDFYALNWTNADPLIPIPSKAGAFGGSMWMGALPDPSQPTVVGPLRVVAPRSVAAGDGPRHVALNGRTLTAMPGALPSVQQNAFGSRLHVSVPWSR
jgi:hypothetical protein